MINRRDLLVRSGAAAAALGLARFPLAWAGDLADDFATKRKLLFFTKSSGFQHSAITRKSPDELSFAEQIVTDLGEKHNFEVTCTKDGRIFTAEKLPEFDAIMFYTTGDLTKPGTDKTPPMSDDGKQALFNLIRSGKGFCRHAQRRRHVPQPRQRQPRPRAVCSRRRQDRPVHRNARRGIHPSRCQQAAYMKVVDKNFPGMKAAGDGFRMHEEWYSLKNHAKNLHVLLVQEPGLSGGMYDRPAYPATWAHEYGKGRVFYTSMGHREDVWTNKIFQSVLLGGLAGHSAMWQPT